MDSERSDDQQEQPQGGDESVEEFKQEVEEDPATAKSPDEDAEKLRGG